jgi:soluble lytic murein transglycosylase
VVLAAGFALARPVAETFPPELRQLAAHAAKRATWPRLRHYAESQKDPRRAAWAFFVLGYQESEAGEYAPAAADLRIAAASDFPLADHARYYWASAADRANDPLQAAETLADFSARFPDSPLRLPALELLAGAWIDAHQPQRALQVLLAEPRVRQRASLALLLARAYSEAGQLQEAARAFQEVYYAFSTTPQASEAAKALASLRSSLGAAFPQPTEEIETTRVENLLKASRSEEALKEYGELLEARPASQFASRWRLGRARCLLRLRRTDEALQALAPGFPGNPALEAERLGLLVNTQARADNAPAMLQALSQLQALDPHSPTYGAALFAAASSYFRQGDWPSAARYYQTLVESVPQADEAREASWRLAWCYYFAPDRARAREALQQHIARHPDSPHGAAALYWLGRLEEERGEIAEALALYALLRQRFVHSYYALKAGQRIPSLPRAPTGQAESHEAPADVRAATLALAIPVPQPPPFPACSPASPGEALRPAQALRELSLDDLAEQYLRLALAEGSASSELRLLLSQVEAAQGKAAAALFDAIKVAPDYPQLDFAQLPREMWEFLYPPAYWKLVERQARANRLDPYLIMGLIRQESAFNPRAVSSADARGLMQILPKTASRSRRASRVRYAGQRLFDPAYNVRFGCAYLRQLLTKFDGKLEQALAAYNAGDFRVVDWLKRSAFQDTTEFLEAIPISATRVYVEAVLRDAAIYRQLLTGSADFAVCPAGASSNRKLGVRGRRDSQ